MTLSIDEAIALFVAELRKIPPLSGDYNPNLRSASHGCDIRVSDVLRTWWFKEHGNESPMPNPAELDHEPFQDAAWELARRGILRSGPVLPLGPVMGGHPNTEADGFSLTAAGRLWVLRYDQIGPFPLDPGRFASLITPYGSRFGSAFVQRITEAAGCYRSLNYLAACAMSGAACESILLALAIVKTGDETAVLRTYAGRDGRRNLIRQITANTRPSIGQGIETATSLLSYWRDNAAHGYADSISELAAHDALSRLLRFAQFVDDNWAVITAPQLD